MRIAILLPLSGPRAEQGKVLLRAAKLSLEGSPLLALDALDTGGTADGAAAAARQAIADADRFILGPLTSSETAAVAPLAREAGIPVIAFTNDSAQAAPGLWTLGISPEQQVARLVAAASSRSNTQFASLVPDSDFGRAMAAALERALADQGLAPPTTKMHGAGMPAITAAVREISDYANRRGPLEARIRAARDTGTPEGRKEARELAKASIPPPPFSVLLLGDLGEGLQEVAAVLPYFDIDRPAVQLIGPALWADPASGSSALRGAWYAAPDAAARSAFTQAYSAEYADTPPPIADLAYDAVAVLKAAISPSGFDLGALTNPAGFSGADGWMSFQPDGRVKRGLAVYRLDASGAVIADPAPTAAY
jgi:hypothetical protein